jgi:hypothetical protein
MDKKKNVLTSEKARKEYMNRTFTPDGKTTLESYVYSLVELLYRLNKKDFPYILPPVLGIPYLKTVMTYETKRDLEIHIKALMHLLALESVEVQKGNDFKEFKLEINKNGSTK